MKAALWIWSAISSSSLKGKVPLRLYTQTGGNHDNRMGKMKETEAEGGCYGNYVSAVIPDVDDDSDRPEIKGSVVTLVPQHFRCYVHA